MSKQKSQKKIASEINEIKTKILDIHKVCAEEIKGLKDQIEKLQKECSHSKTKKKMVDDIFHLPRRYFACAFCGKPMFHAERTSENGSKKHKWVAGEKVNKYLARSF